MKNLFIRAATLGALFYLAGCIPRIEVAAPKEPITINMNVKIEHDIHIKADKEASQLLEKSDGATAEAVKRSAPRGAQDTAR